MTFSLISCAKAPVIEDNTEMDFHGSTMTVYIGWYSRSIPTKRGGTASADREYDRYRETEKKFNFLYDFQIVENPPATFLSKAISGGLTVDMLSAIPQHLYESWLIDVLLPVENVISDPTSEKYRSPAENNVGVYGGTQYGIFPNYWESSPSVGGFIQINLTLLDRYNIDDPHEIIEAGEWDWENFRQFLTKTVINDGDNSFEGMAVNAYGTGTNAITPFLLSNGAHFITEADGRWTCEINSPESREALEYVKSLVDEGLLMEGPVDMGELYFDKGQRWMVSNGSAYSGNQDFDICCVRYPYGPQGNKDTVSTITQGDSMWAFPIFSAYSEEETGAVAEFMFEPLDPDLYPHGWQDMLEDNYFFYHSDFEYYLKGVYEAEYIDKSILEDSFWALDDALLAVMRGTQSPEIALETAEGIIAEEINEKYNK